MLWTAPPPASRCATLRRLFENGKCRLLAQSGSSLTRGFAAGVGSKAGIDAAALTQLPFMIPRLQFVTVEQLLASPAPPIRIPMARSDTYKKAAKEERSGQQGALDL